MESFGVNFPDIAALELVRKRLWSGRAVVFVGAGYSKHALTSRPGLRTAPLWSELCEALRAELYPNADPRAPSDCLRLAEEYAHTLSRDALHARVAELVADDDRTPSALHRDLLRLPWKDVLTTNYDTLLEKAIVECGRRYAPIYTPNDLPRRSAPRIVKLHGSLPYPIHSNGGGLSHLSAAVCPICASDADATHGECAAYDRLLRR
jgi:NAD-dependent SIR2 family protein deacetylase